jgi:hydrogenase maturation protein HypF
VISPNRLLARSLRAALPELGASGSGDVTRLLAPVPTAPDPQKTRTVEARIRGVVQGVGFRPFVHRLAIRHGLAGWVRNEAGAVRLVAQGAQADVESFLGGLSAELPPLARIDTLEVEETRPRPLDGFRVLASDVAPVGRLPVSPDVAICPSCEAELLDPSNRRYRYPFITCTDCGPRFTVIESMPYDRERSTMRAFAQCPECLREYEDPTNRRYHSETNSCRSCGPSVWLESGSGERVARAETALVEAGRLLTEGQIVAVRGLGGFHLAVDATSEDAVARLRLRKERDAKPLAVMVRSLAAAERLAYVSEAEAALLTSRERPIVVLRRRPDAPLAPQIAPGLDSVGVVLAYTPLHLLLSGEVGGRPLVMTSGNVSDEPIATSNEEARLRLGRIADAFLLHDREIVARYDDSVVRVAEDRAVFLRRSRGYAPMPLPLPVPTKEPLLAMGPHLKNTFTLAQGDEAYVSQHVGDLENLETLEHFEDALARFEQLFRIDPRWVVCDLHPGYLSTRLAEESGLVELPAVQHHHAHIAAVLGEHGVSERVLGLAFDGTGYGADGHVWGFELLEADLRGYERLAHLRYAPLPGGDLAARAPWRALLGYASLDPAGRWAEASLRSVPPQELMIARHQMRRRLNSPLASSMGRLFDAAGALLGLRVESVYEGQAAMELEALADGDGGEPLPFPVLREGEDALPVLDPVPLLAALAAEHERGAPGSELAARFHTSLADATARLAAELCTARKLDTVALGGGCFQNARLLAEVRRDLEAAGLRVLAPEALGPNDGGISYGQAVVAAARMSDDGKLGIGSRPVFDRGPGGGDSRRNGRSH